MKYIDLLIGKFMFKCSYCLKNKKEKTNQINNLEKKI